MTIPYLMNCKHIPDGVCLSCVKQLVIQEHIKLLTYIASTYGEGYDPAVENDLLRISEKIRLCMYDY